MNGDAVRDALAEAGEVGPAATVDVVPLGEGASRDSWRVTAGERSYVLKRDPIGDRPTSSRRREYVVLRAASDHGLPVPRPVWWEPDGGRFDTSGFLTELVPGVSSPRRILGLDQDRKDQVVHDLGRTAALLAGVDPTAVQRTDGGAYDGWHASSAADSPAPTAEILAGLADEIVRLAPERPVLAAALRWAELNKPSEEPAVVVHGDFRLGNLLVGETGLEAVVDWEFSRYGDRAEDAAFACLRPWRFGQDGLAAAGLSGLDVLLDGYRSVAGTSLDPGRVGYWQVVNQLRWGAYCLLQADGWRTGRHRHFERLVLGHRLPEIEWDLLTLMEELS